MCSRLETFRLDFYEFHGTVLRKRYNVTTGNFYILLKLAKGLKQKKTSIAGTINKMRKELLSRSDRNFLILF